MDFCYYTAIYPTLSHEEIIKQRAPIGTVTVPETLKYHEDERGEYYHLAVGNFQGIYVVPHGSKTLWTTDKHGNKKSMSIFRKV